MNERDIELVQESFAKLIPVAHETSALFYSNLFINAPELRPLFKGDIQEQEKKFITMLAYIVSSLDNLNELDEMLSNLGKRHRAYKIEEHHYDVVRVSLLATIGQKFNEDFTPELETAWSNFYNMLADKMKDLN